MPKILVVDDEPPMVELVRGYLAREFNLIACFMAKPFMGVSASGCHHNLSLWRGGEEKLNKLGNDKLPGMEGNFQYLKGGENTFLPLKGQAKPGPIGLNCIGGLIKHVGALTAIGTASIALDDGPLVNFCKPAVDHLFSSAADVWGPQSLAVVLTGMGSDGTRGAADIVAAGGSVIAQDEATSVVWGMPGSVAHAGLCSAVLPLDQIAPRIARLMCGGRL
jgi:hypothetical protein